MNKETFMSSMGFLQSIFGKTSKELIEFLWNRFKDTPDDKFKMAINKIIDTFKPTSNNPFPLPVHFNEALGKDEVNKSIQAVAAVKLATSQIGPYRSVSFGDRALHATIRAFGGWVAMCDWKDDDWKFNERKLMDCYKSQLSQNNGPDHLCGHAEGDYIANAGNYLPERIKAAKKQILPVKIDWTGHQEMLATSGDKPEIENKTVKLLSEKMSIKS